MAASLTHFGEMVAPTAAEAALAREASRSLARLLTAKPKKPLRLRIEKEDATEESISVPVSAALLLLDILSEMGKGNHVALSKVQGDLTTQQAADLLNVSHSSLIEQLEQGKIPCRKVGARRHVSFQDVMDYKRRMDENRTKALARLSEIDQELGQEYGR